MRGRLEVVEIERLDPLGVFEDRAELHLHPSPFLLGEIEAREARDVIHRGSVYGHRRILWRARATPCYRRVMGFPRELLADHEEVIFDLKPHWVAVIPSVLWTLVAVAIGVLSRGLLDGVSATVALGVAVVLWLILAVPPFVKWQFTLFVLTTDRMITRSGVIAKHSKEIPLERINDVAFSQSVLDRILGAGDLLIESAG